ncbi:hypothetical protein RDWZM_003443, partial [Blomia tropicalis]
IQKWWNGDSIRSDRITMAIIILYSKVDANFLVDGLLVPPFISKRIGSVHSTRLDSTQLSINGDQLKYQCDDCVANAARSMIG